MVNVLHPASTGPVADQQAIEVFQHQSRIYQRLVDSNYFRHREVYGILHRILTEQFTRPFGFLDLACGDAGGMVQVLRDTAVSHYRGIDLSAAALELAGSNLNALQCSVELEQRDFIEAMGDYRETADVVWIGLSLHHLVAEAKREFMAAVRKALAEDGLFLIYEPTLRAGETRDSFLERGERSVRLAAANILTRDERDEVMRHVRTYDLPETAETWEAMGREAGFGRVRKLYDGPYDLFALFSFEPQ